MFEWVLYDSDSRAGVAQDANRGVADAPHGIRSKGLRMTFKVLAAAAMLAFGLGVLPDAGIPRAFAHLQPATPDSAGAPPVAAPSGAPAKPAPIAAPAGAVQATV